MNPPSGSELAFVRRAKADADFALRRPLRDLPNAAMAEALTKSRLLQLSISMSEARLAAIPSPGASEAMFRFASQLAIDLGHPRLHAMAADVERAITIQLNNRAALVASIMETTRGTLAMYGAIRAAAVSAPALAQFDQAISQASQPGTFWGDFLLLKDGDVPADEKWAVICRMQAGWFRNPLHPVRWRWVRRELSRRAKDNNTTVERELELATRQALLLAVHDVDDTPLPDLLRRVRAALANRVMDDLAGPGWRQRFTQVEVPLTDEDETDTSSDIAYQAEIKTLHQWFWSVVAELPVRQRTALMAVIDGKPLTNAQHQALFRLRRSPAWSALQREAS
jgi:hypothetical protein